MLKKLKDILNTYTDIELEEIDFWVNSNTQVEYIQIGNFTIDLITYSDSKITLLEKENQELKELLSNIEKNTKESDIWGCEVYKGHNCRYSFCDAYNDSCIFCGEPEERK